MRLSWLAAEQTHELPDMAGSSVQTQAAWHHTELSTSMNVLTWFLLGIHMDGLTQLMHRVEDASNIAKRAVCSFMSAYNHCLT